MWFGLSPKIRGTLLGSVLRLDIDHYTSSHPYSIPSDNPFVNENGSRPEIFAYGIRNIWRCDVDEGDPETGYGRGRIICGDVGQGAYEEIDIIKRGRNYGWNSREGFECYRKDKCGKIGPEEFPIYAYSHSVGKSVTGGHVYRGCLNPNLHGLYVYGDYVNGKLFRLKETVSSGSGGSSWENKELTMCGEDVCFNGLVSQYEKNILSFGEDDDGRWLFCLRHDLSYVTADISGPLSNRHLRLLVNKDVVSVQRDVDGGAIC
ncbi:hypothetical protein LSH36_1g16004 [Paralvinella palmiformis]|uniref:Glucose/Sorbosone dehydrogenase domain-containing protein n=1 Tax=Paralvinella palmiformis TaxID=53620 RepID=A0AAD9KFG7_9ANNE|nr:hypothetical protein LSH36_1g16004 [Paralvinella palmiformis]